LDSECATGFCSDGYCCDAACGGDCEACNLAGNIGNCTVRSVDDATEISTTCYYCNGTAGVSVAATSLEGYGCTGACTYCVAGSCDVKADGELCEGQTCMSCLAGACTGAATTGWGEAEGDCAGTNFRCDAGSCVECGGYVAGDNCSGCAGQGGNACWYAGGTYLSCNTVCNDHGAQCVEAHWQDAADCRTLKHFFTCSYCGLGSKYSDYWPAWQNSGTTWCRTTPSYTIPNNNCAAAGANYYTKRICVCTF